MEGSQAAAEVIIHDEISAAGAFEEGVLDMENQTGECGWYYSSTAHLVQSMENQTGECGRYYSTIAHQIQSFENQATKADFANLEDSLGFTAYQSDLEVNIPDAISDTSAGNFEGLESYN